MTLDLRRRSAQSDGEKAESTRPREVGAVPGLADSNDAVAVVYDIKDVDVKPHPVKFPDPDYPDEARDCRRKKVW